MRQNNKTELKELRQTLRKTATPAERKVWGILKNRQIRNLRFFRQYSMNNYILDFYCPKIHLCIEADGGQHSGEQNQAYDKIRTEFLNSKGIYVLRFQNNDVIQNIEGVYDRILKTINHNPLYSPLS